MSEAESLLAACQADRGNADARRALADRIQDDDGETPAVAAALALACEACGCPDRDEPVCRDRFGVWHVWDDVHAMNSGEGARLFGDDFPDPVDAKLCLYRWGRWHLVCPGCRASLVARRAAQTRAANRAAAEGPNLFSGLEE